VQRSAADRRGARGFDGDTQKAGLQCRKHEVSEDCGYLSGKGLIRIEHVENSVLGISRSIAHIMPEGIDAMEGTKEIAGVILGG
jgi:hypothetical protein